MKKTKKIDEKRLAAYAAAASAALMAAAPANAAIHYTAAPGTVVNNGDSVAIDIDGNSSTDIFAGLFGSYTYKDAVIWGGSFAGASYYGYYFDVDNLGTSVFIDSNMDWFNPYFNPNSSYFSAGDEGPLYNGNTCGGEGGVLYNTGTCGAVWGNFDSNLVGPDSGFIGIRFDDGAASPAYNYGWVHVSSVDWNGESYEIDGWAYEDSGAGITAGAMPIVPEPSSIALFAAGATAMLAWRRRKNRR